MKVFVYTYTFLKYNLLISYTISCTCAFMVDHLALGNQLVFFQLSSVTYSSFCRVHASWSFPHPIWHIHWCHDCSAYVRAVIFVRLYGCSSDLTRIHNMTQIPWSSGSYTLSATSSAVSSEPQVQEYFVDVFVGTGLHNLHIDWLWFSEVVSLCCKEKFLGWGVRTILICGYKDQYLCLLFGIMLVW